jgi:hypothetical protein
MEIVRRMIWMGLTWSNDIISSDKYRSSYFWIWISTRIARRLPHALEIQKGACICIYVVFLIERLHGRLGYCMGWSKLSCMVRCGILDELSMSGMLNQ